MPATLFGGWQHAVALHIIFRAPIYSRSGACYYIAFIFAISQRIHQGASYLSQIYAVDPGSVPASLVFSFQMPSWRHFISPPLSSFSCVSLTSQSDPWSSQTSLHTSLVFRCLALFQAPSWSDCSPNLSPSLRASCQLTPSTLHRHTHCHSVEEKVLFAASPFLRSPSCDYCYHPKCNMYGFG
jgi:hypothetical protein